MRSGSREERDRGREREMEGDGEGGNRRVEGRGGGAGKKEGGKETESGKRQAEIWRARVSEKYFMNPCTKASRAGFGAGFSSSEVTIICPNLQCQDSD